MKYKDAFTLGEILIVVIILGAVAALTIPTLKNVSPKKNQVLFRKAIYNFTNVTSEIVSEPTLYKPYAQNVFFYENTLKHEIGGVETIKSFCQNYTNRVNTIGEINCDYDKDELPYKENFTTSDGMRWFVGKWKCMEIEEEKCDFQSWYHNKDEVLERLNEAGYSGADIESRWEDYRKELVENENIDNNFVIKVDVNGLEGPNTYAKKENNCQGDIYKFILKATGQIEVPNNEEFYCEYQTINEINKLKN